jgi:type I restriction enzyme S subunit
MPKGNKNMRNVPNLRFPKFLEKWEVKFIGELSDEFKSGKFIKSEDITKTGQYPVFGGNGLRGFTNKYNHNGEFVLIGRQGALCGNVRFVRGKCYMTEHAIVVSANKHNHTVFLLYLLDKMKLNQYSDQSAQPGLAVNKLLKLRSVVPSLAEQKKIASLLSYIDLRIQTQNKIITQLESLMCGLQKKIFKQQIRFKDKDGNEFPKWEVKKIEDVCNIVGGGTPATSRNEYWNGNIQWFTPTEIKANFVSKSERTISQLGLKNSSAKILPKGTILLTTRATIGEVAIALEECTTNQGFQSLVVKKGMNNTFLFHWIKKNKYELMKRANGSTFPEVSKSEIERIQILIPSLMEQSFIADFFSSINEKIETEIKILKEYEAQKQYLLKNMFV